MSAWRARLEKKQQEQKDEERRKQLEVNEISFPSLSSESAWGSTTGTGKEKEPLKRSFASLATEWKEDDDTQKQKEKEEEERRKMNIGKSVVFRPHTYYSFGDTHSRVEDTYYEENDFVPVENKTNADESDDWRVIERKPRRAPLSTYEKMMREEARQQQEVQEPQFFSDYNQDETIW